MTSYTVFKDFVYTSAKTWIPLCFSIWKLVIFVRAVTGSWSANICARGWGCYISEGLRYGGGETEIRRNHPELLGTHSRGLYISGIPLLGGHRWQTQLNLQLLPWTFFLPLSYICLAYWLCHLHPITQRPCDRNCCLLYSVTSKEPEFWACHRGHTDVCWVNAWMALPF